MNGYPLADRWLRFKGYLFDVLIVGGLLYLLLNLSGTVEQIGFEGAESLSITQRLIWAVVSLVVFIAVHGYLLVKDGRTLGKFLVGTQIVDLNGECLPFAKLMLRYAMIILVWQIPIVGSFIGWLDILWIFGSQKRCLHDVLAGSRVIFTATPGLHYSKGDEKITRRILQGVGLVAVILVGLLIYRGSLIATGEGLEPGNYQLAFSKFRGGSGNDIYGLDVEQGTVAQLTMNYKIFQMQWTADGQEMILSRGVRDNPYLLNVSTGEVKQLNSDTVTPGYNGWSLDGQQRIFTAKEAGDRNQNIYVAQADGTQKRLLGQSAGPDYAPTWSPDGQQVVFWSGPEERWNISVVNADGTNLKQIAQTPTPSIPFISSTFRWSPDGTKLLFFTRNQRGRTIYMIDADGQNLIEVGDSFWGTVDWSPDGTMIAFDGDVYSLCLFQLGEAEPDCQNSKRSPSFSPDGRYLAYASTQYGSASPYICVTEMTTGRDRCFPETTAGGDRPVWRP